MKKKIFKLIAILALSVLVVLAICSCTGTEEVRLQHLILTDGDGNAVDGVDNKQKVPYGTELSDILPAGGLVVKAVYSDNSSKKLSAKDYSTEYYKVNSDGTSEKFQIPDIPDTGEYEIKIKYQSQEAVFYFSVYKAYRSDYKLTLSKTEWEYDEVPAEASVSNFTPAEGYDDTVYYYGFEKNRYDALTDKAKNEYWNYTSEGNFILGETAKNIEPGQYYLYAVIPGSDNYEVTYTAISNDLQFTVSKAVLGYNGETVQNMKGFYNYKDKTGDITLGDVSIERTDLEGKDYMLYDKTGDSVSGNYEWVSPSQTLNVSDDGKSYEVRYVLSDSVKKYYTVTEGTTAKMVVSINKGGVAKPAVGLSGTYSAGSGPYPDNTNRYVIVNSEGYYVNFGVWDNNFMELEIKNGEGVICPNTVVSRYNDTLDINEYYLSEPITDVGTYTVKVKLKDKVNFFWGSIYDADQTDTEDITYVFDIKDKIIIAEPGIKLDGSIVSQEGTDYVVYDGKKHSVLFTGWDTNLFGAYVNSEYIDLYESTQKEANYLLKEAGIYNFEIKFYDENVYAWEDGSCAPITYVCEVKARDIIDTDGIYEEVNLHEDVVSSIPPKYVQYMNNWVDSEDGLKKTMTDGYVAGVYFSLKQNEELKAEFVGTTENIHSIGADGNQYSMTNWESTINFVQLNNLPEKSYSATGEGWKNEMMITDKSNSQVIDKITDWDVQFFTGITINLPLSAMQTDKVNYSVSESEAYIKVKMTADYTVETSGETATDAHTEVIMIYGADEGNYIGHEVTTTHTYQNGQTETYEIQFLLM